MIYDENFPDKWNWVDNTDFLTNYNIITYDDFIKLVEKYINNVKKIAESTNPPKIDEWDKNVPAENTDGMGTFESEISNKNHILTENATQILKNTLGESHVEKVVNTSIYKRIDNLQQDIKQAFADIDTSVLYKIRELFEIIRDEKDIEKIKNILNIIDRLVVTKNKVLNDFDIDMIDELNK